MKDRYIEKKYTYYRKKVRDIVLVKRMNIKKENDDRAHEKKGSYNIILKEKKVSNTKNRIEV